MNLDFNLLLQSPDFSTRSVLTIDALAPLSMVTSMPGKYYRSQPEPTHAMLYGLLENALGWHIADRERKLLINRLKQKHQQPVSVTDVGYVSILQFHVRFAMSVVPPMIHYDDLWAQHLKGGSFLDGSRNYDKRVIGLMNSYRAKKVVINDRASASKDVDKLNSFQEGDQIHVNVIRRFFPQYYASPTPREYVLPQGAYKFTVETSPDLARQIGDAIDEPAAPLYLGSNDGWVEAKWEVMQ